MGNNLSAKQKILKWLMTPGITKSLGEIFFLLSGRRNKEGKAYSKAKNILVIRLDEFGDIVLMSPFWRELRKKLPQARITAIVNPATFNLMEACPHIDELITYSVPTLDSNIESQWRRYKHALNYSVKSLIKNHYDLAIYPRWDSDYYHASFLAYFSGAPERIAYSEKVISDKRARNRGYDQLFTDLIFNNELKHEVERNLDIIRHMGFNTESNHLESWVTPEDNKYAEEFLASHNIRRGGKIIALCPSGGSSHLKQWPLDNYIKLCKELVKLYECPILITGSKEEIPLAQQVAERAGKAAVNMAGETSLRQLAAILKKCSLYVGNDTGTTHMALSLGLPVIAIFGPTCTHRFGPWGDNYKLLQKVMPCNPCGDREHIDLCTTCIKDRPYCIEDITVNEVERAIGELL